jgi:D-aminoacyl-tRNA deacylase
MSKLEASAEKTYEATHHGPLLKTPSLFVELGGSKEMIESKESAAIVVDSAYDAVERYARGEAEYSKVVIGIGSNHYPEKFSKVALEKGYAFSHIMPKYAILNGDGSNNLDVLEQALTRSAIPPECAIVDWKSLNSQMKEITLKKLGELGMDHEKV